jgi:phosphatidylserine/phosphatidylglycerophosphate/cardiolipin synthase-like enzyme
MKLRFLVFFLVILLIGTFTLDKYDNNITGNAIKEIIPNEIGAEPIIYFCPRDNCSQALFEFISSANESIHCALFDLDLDNIIKLLQDKSKQIDVKLVIDNDYYEELKENKFIKKDTSSQFTHNKFCIIDNKKISTGSFNPTNRGAYFNNNNLIIIDSQYLAQNYEDEFKELWNHTFGKGKIVKRPIISYNNKRIENYFCPEDKCSKNIINEVKKATQSIHFMTFSFTHTAIGTELVLKLKQGVEINGIFENRGSGSKYSRFNLLRYQGANIIKDKNPYVMHHKVFIIDNKTVITGSFNPSKNADTRNDENILIIEDENIAKRYIEEFSLLFS